MTSLKVNKWAVVITDHLDSFHPTMLHAHDRIKAILEDDACPISGDDCQIFKLAPASNAEIALFKHEVKNRELKVMRDAVRK